MYFFTGLAIFILAALLLRRLSGTGPSRSHSVDDGTSSLSFLLSDSADDGHAGAHHGHADHGAHDYGTHDSGGPFDGGDPGFSADTSSHH